MNIEDIKVGETYNVRVTVEEKKDTSWLQVRTGKHAYSLILGACEAEAFSPISPANGIKNTETDPQYDPCRKFRKGDKVRVVERNGRYQPNIPVDELWSGLLTVSEDENFCNNLVKVRCEDGREKLSHWWYLELVTPVEELETADIFDDKKTGMWVVTKDNFTHAYFPYRCEVSDNIANSKEEAKAAAEAECDHLNAEYRKEQDNG